MKQYYNILIFLKVIILNLLIIQKNQYQKIIKKNIKIHRQEPDSQQYKSINKLKEQTKYKKKLIIY